MTTELLLDVGSLHAGYGRAEVLHGVNLKAKAGRRYCLNNRGYCLNKGLYYH